MDPKDPKAGAPADEEILDGAEGGEEIDLGEDPTPADKRTVDVDEVEKEEKEFKALDKNAFAAMRKSLAEERRKAAELQKKLKEHEEKQVVRADERPPAYVPPRQRQMIAGEPVPETDAEWDALARRNWRLAVDMRSIMKAQEIQTQTRQQQEASTQLEASKNEVLEKHPELNDSDSEKAKIFLEVLAKNPSYVTMSEGPLLAMYKMEKRMRELGKTDAEIFGKDSGTGAQRETMRVQRTALSGGGGRTPEKAARTVTLSKDELEFCEAQGISTKDFAKRKLEQAARSKGAQL